MKCPCGLGPSYEKCCGRYIERHELPPTPEALMRSRYTAFTRLNHDYLQKTQTRPLGPLDPHIHWISLTVLKAEGNEVEFIAKYQYEGKKGELREKSTFHQYDGRWVYLSK